MSSAYCILHLYASTSVVHMYIRDTICMLYSVVGLSDNDKCLSVFCFILIPLFLASTFVTTYTRTHTHTHTHTCAASIELNTLHKTPSKACRRPIVMPRVHQVHVARIQVVSTCIPYRRLLYPVSATKSSELRRHVSTCIRIQVARPGYLHPETCIWCIRGLSRQHEPT